MSLVNNIFLAIFREENNFLCKRFQKQIIHNIITAGNHKKNINYTILYYYKETNDFVNFELTLFWEKKEEKAQSYTNSPHFT